MSWCSSYVSACCKSSRLAQQQQRLLIMSGTLQVQYPLHRIWKYGSYIDNIEMYFNFYTPVFRRDVLWHGDICPSVRVSVRPTLFPSVRVSVRQFSTLFPNMLWHIELIFCMWLCFTVLQIKFEWRQFASSFVGGMPLLELRILEIHSFPLFSLTCFDILSWKFTYDFVILYCTGLTSLLIYQGPSYQKTRNTRILCIYNMYLKVSLKQNWDHLMNFIFDQSMKQACFLCSQNWMLINLQGLTLWDQNF